MIHVLMLCDVDEFFFLSLVFALRGVGFWVSSTTLCPFVFSSLFCVLISLHFDNDVLYLFFLLLLPYYHIFTSFPNLSSVHLSVLVINSWVWILKHLERGGEEEGKGKGDWWLVVGRISCTRVVSWVYATRIGLG